MRLLLVTAIALVLAGCRAEAPADAADAGAAPAVDAAADASADAAAAADADAVAPARDLEPAHVGLMAHEPWSRPLAPGATVAAGYMHLMNHTAQPETLVGASAEGVGRIEIHDIIDVDGVKQMRPIEGGVALAVDGMAAFQPGGKHLMFFDVTRPWAEGDTVPVTLSFASGTTATVDFAVSAEGGSEGEGSGEGGHQHHADHSDHGDHAH